MKLIGYRMRVFQKERRIIKTERKEFPSISFKEILEGPIIYTENPDTLNDFLDSFNSHWAGDFQIGLEYKSELTIGNERGVEKMTKLPDTLKRVHCHICPLKEFCTYAESEGSFLKSRVDLWDDKWQYFDVEQSEGIPNRPRPETDEQNTRIHIASANCPLRKMILLGG